MALGQLQVILPCPIFLQISTLPLQTFAVNALVTIQSLPLLFLSRPCLGIS